MGRAPVRMADKTKKRPKNSSSTSSSSSYLLRTTLLAVAALAVYVGIELKSSYDVYDVRDVPIYPARELKGPLAPNDRLAEGEFLLKGKVIGPESIIAEGRKLYTGTQDGKIVEITDGEITKEFILNSACKPQSSLKNCFRPLGMRRLNSKELIVADAWQGLYTVNMDEMSIRKILDANIEIDGEPMRFADDLDVIDGENIVLSDASTRYSYHQLVEEVNEGIPSGRILHVHVSTKKVTVLAKGFYFANGVQLFPDKKSLLVCETFAGRLHRVHLSGEKKGKTELFLDNLPGHPDNVRLSHDGKSFWVAFAGTKPNDNFSFLDFSKKYPLLRRVLITFVPHSWLLNLQKHHQPKHAMTIEVSLSGEIISSLHDSTAKVVKAITQTTDDGTYLYLGSFHEDYIVRVKK